MNNQLYTINEARVHTYVGLNDEIKKDSTLPYIVSPNLPDVGAPFPVVIYAKQPQEWGSSRYDQKMEVKDMLDYLDVEYLTNLNLSANQLFKPIKVFSVLKNSFKDTLEIGFILNNLVKIGRRGKNANKFMSEANDLEEFKILDLKEYVILNPELTIIFAGTEDYYGRASYLFMNDEELTLSKEDPVRFHKDFRGKPVIHTYHPNYWHNLVSEEGVPGEERILNFIEEAILNTYTDWKNVNNKTSKNHD